MEKKNNDKGELIDRTAWFTRLPPFLITSILRYKRVPTVILALNVGRFGVFCYS